MSTTIAEAHQVGALVEGLFRWVWQAEAHRICGLDIEGPAAEDERWKARRTAYYTLALEHVLEVFPEPLRAEIMAKRNAIITEAVGLN